MGSKAFVPAGERTVPAGSTQPCHDLPTPALLCLCKQLIHVHSWAPLFLGRFMSKKEKATRTSSRS
jgi:hypothetical protein